MMDESIYDDSDYARELRAKIAADHAEELANAETDASEADTREKLLADLDAMVNGWKNYDGDFMRVYSTVAYAQVKELLDRQAAITRREALLENPLHSNPYVGLVRGEQWERKESSDYYCGKCGWKVTDHDSYCPECGGALHRAPDWLTSQSDAPKTEKIAENGATKSEMRDFDDSREKLEADVREYFSHWIGGTSRTQTAIIGWFDRQAAITTREWEAEWGDYQAQRIDELLRQRDRLRADLNTCELDNDGLRAEVADLKRANERQARKIHDVCELNEELNSKLDQCMESYADAKDSRDQLRAELNTLNLAYETLRAESTRTDDGWMRLPVDADGETIFVGDVLESDVFGRIEVEGYVRGAVAFWSYDPQPARLATCPCDLTRHVHERTVEDVLMDVMSDYTDGHDVSEIVAKYAAELRELMGGDA